MKQKDINFKEYIPLVKTIAGRYKNSAFSFDDLVQEGLLGVFEAEERYNPRKGTLFTTYATYWIKKKILEYINREKKYFSDIVALDEKIDVPVKPVEEENKPVPEAISLLEDIQDIERRILKLFFEDRKPLDVISRDLNISRERVRQLKKRVLRKLRINRKLTDYLYSLNR
ncbi:MAG: sigma-70 family RNA polymerase sigma factor [Elusimicrobia bacterium]|nr:sigma-70 family RNA polymerase sigma factor [Elusimicrobiota bacterium]